jgi:hypothetical protein
LEKVALLAVMDRVQRRAQPERGDVKSLEVFSEHVLEPGPAAEETHGGAMIARLGASRDSSRVDGDRICKAEVSSYHRSDWPKLVREDDRPKEE